MKVAIPKERRAYEARVATTPDAIKRMKPLGLTFLIEAGAGDYIPKPADADVIDAALNAGDRALPQPPEHPMSADRVRWEHIQRVFEQCERNVSETARRLNMHRRTLQRILAKHAPRETA